MASLKELPGQAQLTVSIGLAASHPLETPDELLRRCDDALYQSKRAGRDRVTVDRSSPVPSAPAFQPDSMSGRRSAILAVRSSNRLKC
jgi:hypothetical protein